MAPAESSLVYAVVGASRGLGLELVKQLLADGSTHVIATARTPEKAAELQKLSQQHGDRLRIYRLDVIDEKSLQEAVQAITSDFDGVDVLINNAGVAGAPTLALETPVKDLRDTLEVNAIAPFAILREFLPLLRKRQTRKVVNVGSIMGSNAFNHSLLKADKEQEERLGKTYLPYKTAKAALNMVTTVVANELAAESFTVITLHPGHVATDMGSSDPTSFGKPPLTPPQSVAGQLKVIARLTPKDTGRYLTYSGDELEF